MMPDGQNAATDSRRVQALDLRLAGASYRTIGAQLGVSHQTAYEDVQIMLREYCTETADEVRSQELHRLDRLLLGQWRAAAGGDTRATETVLRIMAQRAKLLGLEQTVVNLTVKQQQRVVDAEVAKLAAALGVTEDQIRAELEALGDG